MCWPLTLAAVSASPVTQFDRLVLTLQTAPAPWRVEFASLALTQLAAAYHDEAGLARSPSPDDNTRWSRSVDAYAYQLLFLKQDVEQAADVSIVQTAANDAIIALRGTRMMLSHPRPGQQRAFEQTLVEQFCQQRDCGLEPLTPPTVETARSVSDIKPDWLFTEEGTVCRHQGLQLSFPRGSDTGALRLFCSALFNDVQTLQNELNKLQQFGVPIQWRNLSFNAATHTLHLNHSGDTLMLDLPILQRHPKLLPLLQPWLADRIQGRAANLSLSASELGWP